MTIGEEYIEFVKKLSVLYEMREAQTIADWIFEDMANLPRHRRISNRTDCLDQVTALKLDEALTQLLQNKPVQYVLGEAWFYKMRLKVNEHVLIPRPETEELVQWIVDDISSSESKQIVDIGTGSGCIAIALKKELPTSTIMALDVSKEALKLARENASLQKATIQLKEINFLNPSSWTTLPAFNIIVSNPPYIPAGNKTKLAKNVVDFEPHIALFVDEDPLIFYSSIARFALTHLTPGGSIYLEVHEDFANEVKTTFNEQKLECVIRKDIFGRDRMVKAFGKQ